MLLLQVPLGVALDDLDGVILLHVVLVGPGQTNRQISKYANGNRQTQLKSGKQTNTQL